MNHRKNKNVIIILAAFIGLLLAFFIGLTVGSATSVYEDLTTSDGNVEIAKVINLYEKTRSNEVSFDQFWGIWDKIKTESVDESVDDVRLFYGAIQGMVASLGDPYSVYFPPQEAKEFAEGLSGEFEGIGAEIGIKEEQLTIIAPLPSSPAEIAGLRPEDKVFAINGEDTAGITIEQAVTKIRGPEGTQVNLSIMHAGAVKVEDIAITRDRIDIPTVIWEMKENDIAYLRISYFNEETNAQFDKAVKELLLKSPRGIILDMRSNPGGFLDSAVRIGSEWIEEGKLIVEEKGRQEEMRKHMSSGTHRLVDMPTVILIDGGTASGSEIVAGALQDHEVAQVIGRKSFGKGSVQNFEVLPDGSAIKITVAKWYTPRGRQITDGGIIPDLEIEIDPEKLKKDQNGDFIDPDIEQAIDILLAQ